MEAPERLGHVRHAHVGREAAVVRVPALGAVVGPLPHPLRPDRLALRANAVHPGGPQRTEELGEVRAGLARRLNEAPHGRVLDGRLRREHQGALRRHRGLLADPGGRPEANATRFAHLLYLFIT